MNNLPPGRTTARHRDTKTKTKKIESTEKTDRGFGVIMAGHANRFGPSSAVFYFPVFLLLTGCIGAGTSSYSLALFLLVVGFLGACRPVFLRRDIDEFTLRALTQSSSSGGGPNLNCLASQDFTNGFDLSQDLTTTSDGFRMDGQGDNTGAAVSTAGDINGDGIGDVLVSSYYSGGNGRSYVVFGRSGGNSNVTLPASSGEGFFIAGDGAISMAATKATGGADINGDGFDDIIVTGRYRTYAARTSAGALTVIPGRTSGFSDITLSSLSPGDGFLIGGAAMNDYIGLEVDIGADFNGDGIADMTFDNYQWNSNDGISYVLYGRNGTSNIDMNALGSGDFFFFSGVGTTYGIGAVGSTVAGDFNGDGLNDFVSSAYTTATIAGSTFIIFGKSNQANLNMSAWSGGDGVRIDGGTAFYTSGLGLRSAGDVNGDGFDDLLIGGNGYGGGIGRAWLVFGGNSMSDFVLNSMSSSQGIRITTSGTSALANSLDTAGDINNDGFDDILLGAPQVQVGANVAAGTTYVIFGKASGWSDINVLSLSASDGFAVTGAGANYFAGAGSGPAGDVNGDNCDDIIIGSPGAGVGVGQAHVIFGGNQN